MAKVAVTRGFSLLELVIVVVIIGILAAIAVPRMAGAHDRAYMDAAMQLGHDLDNGVSLYIHDFNAPPHDFESWVCTNSGPDDHHYVGLAPVRRNLADPAADVMPDHNTLRLEFKNGLVATYTIDARGSVKADFTKP